MILKGPLSIQQLYSEVFDTVPQWDKVPLDLKLWLPEYPPSGDQHRFAPAPHPSLTMSSDSLQISSSSPVVLATTNSAALSADPTRNASYGSASRSRLSFMTFQKNGPRDDPCGQLAPFLHVVSITTFRSKRQLLTTRSKSFGIFPLKAV